MLNAAWTGRRQAGILLTALNLMVGFAGGMQTKAAIAQTIPSARISSAGICPAEMDERIQAVVRQSGISESRWGILIETQGEAVDRDVIYAHNAEQFFVPASNAKIFVTAAALHALGADFQIHTAIYRMRPVRQRSSNYVALRVAGRGDPSLTDAELRSLAQQIREQGITHIDQLILDDSYFQGESVSSTWEAEDLQAGYGAPANSLILNQNEIVVSLYPQEIGQPLRLQWQNPAEAAGWQVINTSRTVSQSAAEYVSVGRDLERPILYIEGQLQVGSAPDESAIAITQPAQYFLEHFQDALAAEQITVDDVQISVIPSLETGTEIAAVDSAPLSELLTEANQNSNNLYAEALLRTLGAVSLPEQAQQSALYAGVRSIATSLADLGIDASNYSLADGSGLSRRNLVTPAALVDTLQAIAQSPDGEIYRNSLAVAGTSGTLQSRFQNTAIVGRLWGKTGTLRDAVALSGYFAPPQYSPLAFSILVNDPSLSLQTARQTIDQIILLLNQMQDCEVAPV